MTTNGDETNAPTYRWFVLFVLLFATVAQGVVLTWPAPLLDHVAGHYAVDLGAATGAMMVAFTTFVTIGAIVGGVCCDKFGWVPTLLVSVSLLTLATLGVLLLGQGFGTLILARALEGLGAGPIIAAVGGVSVEWFPQHQRGTVAGVQGVGLSLGVALGFALVPQVFVSTGSFLAAAAWMSVFPMVAIVLLLAVTMGPKHPVFASDTDGGLVNTDSDLRTAAKLPVFYIGILCIFFAAWIMQAFNNLMPVYLSAAAPLGAGHGVLLAGKLMGLVQVSLMIGSLLSGVITEKLFRQNIKAAIATAFLLLAVFAYSVRSPAVAGNLKVLPIALFLVGFFEGWVVPNSLAFISMNFPVHIVGKMTGIWMGLGILGGTVGVIAGSMLLHRTGLYFASITAVSMAALCGLLFSLFLNPPLIFRGSEEARRELAT